MNCETFTWFVYCRSSSKQINGQSPVLRSSFYSSKSTAHRVLGNIPPIWLIYAQRPTSVIANLIYRYQVDFSKVLRVDCKEIDFSTIALPLPVTCILVQDTRGVKDYRPSPIPT